MKSKIVASLDAGQIDARMIACGSRDRTYVRALFEDYDIHAEWARRLALRYPDFIGGKKNLSDADVMEKFRSKQVKSTWVFALFYGASLRTTAGRFGVDESVLKPEYEEFWRQFAGVKAWQETLVKQFEVDGYVQMLGGLRRRAPLGKGQIVNCVDLGTECLTEDGWRYVDSIKRGTKIYTKNPKTGHIELQECFGVTRSVYKGKVCVLDGSISAVTTPNHRWLITEALHKSNESGEVKFITSEEFIAGTSTQRIHLVGEPVGQNGGLWTDDEVRFIGWVLTDGYFHTHNRVCGTYHQIGIVQSHSANPHKVKLIDELFERLFDGVRYEDKRREDKKFAFTRYERKATTWKVYNSLTERIFAALPEKTATPEFLRQLSTRQLRLLQESMLLGDGCWSKKYQKFTGFACGKKAAADIFSMLCVLLGQNHTVKYRDMSKYNGKQWPSMLNSPKMSGCWYIRFRNRIHSHAGSKARWEDFDGEVWCPQVPNQTFIARRDGKVYVTGNTPVQGATNRIVMHGMNRLSETRLEALQPNMQIHDDLTYCFDSEHDYEDNIERIVDTMLDCREFDWICVPLVVELKEGPTWADQEKVGTFSSVRRLKWPVMAKEFQ